MSNFSANNIIHPTAIVHEDVDMGSGNFIGPYVILHKGVRLGNFNRFEAMCSIGAAPEHRDHFLKSGLTKIGSYNIFREYVTVNAPTNGITKIGDNCVMLRGSHAGHDVIMEDHANISCNVLIGGHTIVMTWANLGLGAIVHQNQIIGSFSMVGMNSSVTKSLDVEPGKVYVGSPAVFIKMNAIGLQRNNVLEERLKQEIERYKQMRKVGKYLVSIAGA